EHLGRDLCNDPVIGRVEIGPCLEESSDRDSLIGPILKCKESYTIGHLKALRARGEADIHSIQYLIRCHRRLAQLSSGYEIADRSVVFSEIEAGDSLDVLCRNLLNLPREVDVKLPACRGFRFANRVDDAEGTVAQVDQLSDDDVPGLSELLLENIFSPQLIYLFEKDSLSLHMTDTRSERCLDGEETRIPQKICLSADADRELFFDERLVES